MSDVAEQRMRAYEEMFLRAAALAEGTNEVSRFNPIEVLFKSMAASDGSVLFAPLGAVLVAELDAWQRVGVEIGYFRGDRRYSAAVAESDVLKVYFEWMAAAPLASETDPTDADEFQLFLVRVQVPQQ
ncbi:hypothetical protein ACWGST_14310 [Agromyces sp. NPDC055520]